MATSAFEQYFNNPAYRRAFVGPPEVPQGPMPEYEQWAARRFGVPGGAQLAQPVVEQPNLMSRLASLGGRFRGMAPSPITSAFRGLGVGTIGPAATAIKMGIDPRGSAENFNQRFGYVPYDDTSILHTLADSGMTALGAASEFPNAMTGGWFGRGVNWATDKLGMSPAYSDVPPAALPSMLMPGAMSHTTVPADNTVVPVAAAARGTVSRSSAVQPRATSAPAAPVTIDNSTGDILSGLPEAPDPTAILKAGAAAAAAKGVTPQDMDHLTDQQKGELLMNLGLRVMAAGGQGENLATAFGTAGQQTVADAQQQRELNRAHRRENERDVESDVDRARAQAMQDYQLQTGTRSTALNERVARQTGAIQQATLALNQQKVPAEIGLMGAQSQAARAAAGHSSALAGAIAKYGSSSGAATSPYAMLKQREAIKQRLGTNPMFGQMPPQQQEQLVDHEYLSGMGASPTNKRGPGGGTVWQMLDGTFVESN